MKSKAYDEKTIAEIREKRKNGAKVMQLAIEYFVHYRTIENYCKSIERPRYRDNFMDRFMQWG